MAIKVRDPLAVCDVCFKEFTATWNDDKQVHVHPDFFFTVRWRSSQAKCCSKECAIRHIEAT